MKLSEAIEIVDLITTRGLSPEQIAKINQTQADLGRRDWIDLELFLVSAISAVLDSDAVVVGKFVWRTEGNVIFAHNLRDPDEQCAL